ncbi:hypothetical protein Tco_0940259 [Tanacetum coccineum]|uniref:Uncharacterized protein n=1 Tax=Tanacetum coccineum TaxID=301880 RepID=A0ABQ5DTM4_9ASTR
MVKENSLDYGNKDVHANFIQDVKSKRRCLGQVVDVDLVVIESSGTESEVQDDSSRSGNDTDADDAEIRPIYDEEPMAEVQLTAEYNIFAIGQQHTEQPEIINKGRVDQYPGQCQVKSPMLDSSLDNQTTDYSKQSLESENILLKKTVAQFQKDFSRMEAHSKIKKEIDAYETINIELEHSVAKILTENEHLNKENETLKKNYKDLYDSIKITRSKTIEQTTSLLANNADLKAQIQEKVFAIATLKNDFRKLKGNSVDTKFAKTSVLGKPILQSLRNQSFVRQPNAFKSERPQIFYSNDMVHNHYLDEAKKKTQERDRNSKTSVMSFARFQSTADGSKPKPRSNNQTPWSLSVKNFQSVGLRWLPTGKFFEFAQARLTVNPHIEHPSDTYVFTVKMEILLEPTSNKLLVGSRRLGQQECNKYKQVGQSTSDQGSQIQDESSKGDDDKIKISELKVQRKSSMIKITMLNGTKPLQQEKDQDKTKRRQSSMSYIKLWRLSRPST